MSRYAGNLSSLMIYTDDGSNPTAIRDCFAKGDQTTISTGRNPTSHKGEYSTAEGRNTIATKEAAHAEGFETAASGVGSHAEGNSTRARGDYQHVSGKFNVEDSAGKYAVIVGGGADDMNRSNIYTLDWDGNVFFKGVVASSGSYAVCETGSDNLAKSVSISGFDPVVGAKVAIKFPNGHKKTATKDTNEVSKPVTGNYPSLAINGGTAYPIKVEGFYAGENFVREGATHEFIFTGSDWEDLTANVVYKGTDDNGDYLKYRNGEFTYRVNFIY